MEEDFPRGKRQKLDEHAELETKQKGKQDGDLFSEFSKPADEKKKLRQLRKASLKEDETKLLPEMVSPGMLVLGCVAEVRDFEVIVSLPNGLTGTVAITNISDAYTKLLENLAKTEEGTMDDDVPNLDQLFYVGKVVRCKIDSISEKRFHKSAALSLNPKHVNAELQHLKSGMVLTGCVSSCEDHGYVIDIGVRGISAFLQNDEAAKYREAYGEDRGQLFVGSYLHCMVNPGNSLELASGESRVVNVIAEPRIVHRALINDQTKIRLQSLLPGTVGNATITKVSKRAVSVSFLSYTGIIQQSHLELPLNKYEIQQQIRVAVLYVNPSTKVLSLTQLLHLVTPDLAPARLFGSLQVGQVFDEATVTRIDVKRGVYLKLPEKMKAFAGLNDMSENMAKNIASKLNKGAVCRCRVCGFDLVDRLVHVSLKRSVIEQPFFSYADITPTAVLQCAIRAIHPGGVSVTVTNRIFGFIPRIHLAEVLLKHPEKKFVPGKKLKCKVLSVDAANSKLMLTHKKSLMDSKLASVTSYDDCHPGLVTEGCVVSVKPAGLVIVFYNNVKGFAPRRELSDQPVDYPEKLFYVGQTVKCRVLSSDPAHEKLILSLRVSSSRGLPSTNSMLQSTSSAVPDDWRIGKIVDCHVVNVRDGGIDVLLTDNISAFLPKAHLSDHQSNYAVLMNMYQEGDTIDHVMYVGHAGGVVVTRKPSMLRTSADEKLVMDISSLKPGYLGVGVLKRKMPYGVFVDILNGLTGLAPNKFLVDRYHPDPGSLFHDGQTLAVKVTEVDHEKNRFLVSLRSNDVFHGDVNIGLGLLSDYLAEYQLAVNRFAGKDEKSHLVGFTVGQIVKAKVTKVTDNGVLCMLPNKVKAFATLEHMPGVVCKAGQECEAAVLHVDIMNECVQLTLNKDVIKAVHGYKDNKFTQVQEGQSIKSEVQLVTEDFVLVMLKGHASGQFAYLPARRHLNDLLERQQYCVTQINKIVVKRLEAGKILCVLEIHEQSSIAVDSTGRKLGHGLPLIESIATAKIQKIYDLQMNVTVNGCPGRVHVTEAVDEPEPGVSPLERFKVGSDIKVKIIGYRSLKGHKYLPITHAEAVRTILECTARPSKMTVAETDLVPKVGDQMMAYVVSQHGQHLFRLQMTPNLHGRLHILNASDDIEKLKHSDEHFRIGTGHLVKVIGRGLKDGDLDLTIADREPELRAGVIVPALVLGVINNRGLHLQLPCHQVGDVHFTDMSDEYVDHPETKYEVNHFVRGFVVSESAGARRKWIVSLRPSRVCGKVGKVVDREITSINDLHEGDVVRGYVASATASVGVLISLSSTITGKVQHGRLSKYFFEDLGKAFPAGKVVTAKIVSVDSQKEHISLSLLEEDTGVPECISKEFATCLRKQDENVTPRKGTKRKAVKDSDTEDGSKTKMKKQRKDTSAVEDRNDKTDKSEIQSEKPCLSVPFSWVTKFTPPQQRFQDSDSDDSGFEGQEKSPSRKRKKTYGRDNESAASETGVHHDSSQEPQTDEEFARLVLASPKSSQCWLRYVAFRVSRMDFDGARAVFERAVIVVPATEEKECLNLWTGYLNFENTYGTQARVDEVLKQAQLKVDPVAIQQQLCGIYARTGKTDAALEIYRSLLRRSKVRAELPVWLGYAGLLFSSGKVDEARRVHDQALQSLEPRLHIEMSRKFAQLEFKDGSVERGKTLFENMVTTYPRRTDIWSVYIDVCIKYGDIDQARSLFDRVTSLSLPTKRIKFLFDRYLKFETTYGTEDTVNTVRQKALGYVQSNMTD